MGVVIKQSFFSSIFGYLGIVIGYVNVIILMPKFLSLEEIGLYRAVIAIVMLLVPFAMLGSSATMQRFFPRFSEDKEKLIVLSFSILLGGYTLVSTVFLSFKSIFFDYFASNAARINDYYYLIPVLLIFVIIFSLFEAFSKANLNILFPNFLRDVVYKLFTTGLIICLALDWIDFDFFLYSQIIFYIVISIVLLIHISRRYRFLQTVRKIQKPTFNRQIISFSLFSFLSVAGVTIVTYIDQIMVTRYLGLPLNGIYTTAVFIAVVIEYPKRFVSQISYQILVNSYEKNDNKKIEEHYKKASINQGIIGGLLFLLIMINIDNIFDFMPKGEKFAEGRYVLLLVGLAKLSNMIFSLSSEIISVSKYYRYNVFMAAGLGIVTVLSNLILIPRYGINGAAIATLISFLIYDLLKFSIVRYHLGIHPFTRKTILLLLFLVMCYFGNTLLPSLDSFLFDAILRSFVVSSFFVFLTYVASLSAEINNLIRQFLSSLVAYFSR